MALINVPVWSMNPVGDDLFDSLFELTFPPHRYTPVARRIANRLRRDNSDEMQRLYRELTGLEPGIRNDGDTTFETSLDVKHYRPDELSVKVEGDNLVVKGKHVNETENSFQSSEFVRKYTLPKETDPRSITSSIDENGVLNIKALQPKKDLAVEAPKDNKNFVLSLDMSGYQPEEVSINVKGNTLVIHGETKDEKTDGGSHSSHRQQFTQRFTLPHDVNMKELASRFTKDKKLIIEAPRDLSQGMRQLEIKNETEEKEKVKEK